MTFYYFVRTYVDISRGVLTNPVLFAVVRSMSGIKMFHRKRELGTFTKYNLTGNVKLHNNVHNTRDGVLHAHIMYTKIFFVFNNMTLGKFLHIFVLYFIRIL